MDHVYFETKVATDAAGAISGLAWKFGAPDRVGDWIEPGAFRGAKLPTPMLFAHDMRDPVGIWDRIEERADGLHVSGRLLVDDVARAREVRAFVQSGAVRGLSIGFIAKNAAARTGGGRTIRSLELLEVSLVTLPMHPGARVTGAKSVAAALTLADAIRRTSAAIRGK
ncbi:HK97 family phage prohead protease [Ancylobacter terrae]|uniref:HK97 family phage prohead protease n=1 Tax=Ancylobacter sp. sgz301288 TaxID=3342077 RepID=UPI00385B57AC